MLLSEDKEIEMRRQADTEILEAYGAYSDKELTSYLGAIGTRMAKLSHRPTLLLEFKVLDSPVVNAFAVPGGYIYMTRRALAYLTAELAFVEGHKIGHVTARHSAQQYTKAMLAQAGLQIGSVISPTFRQFAKATELGVGMLFKKF